MDCVEEEDEDGKPSPRLVDRREHKICMLLRNNKVEIYKYHTCEYSNILVNISTRTLQAITNFLSLDYLEILISPRTQYLPNDYLTIYETSTCS